MMFRRAIVTACLVAGGMPGGAARAADKPVYAPAPAWVKPVPPIDPAALTDDASIFLVMDSQQRLENGQVWSYYDGATRAASTQILGQIGTISLPWQPDKGDLIVHRAEIVRGAEHIDLLARGERFSVLRREQQLEQQQLNGVLTATMAVEGLRVGDILRLSFSITQKDPVLQGNVQTISPLLSAPFRVQYGRTRLIWPEGLALHWKSYSDGAHPTESKTGGFRELSIATPLPKQPDLPSDAPVRYQHLPILEATSFADWAAVSKVMAPLYRTDGLIAPRSPLAAEVARIEQAESDPLKRTALALQLVQGKIRYLFKGMEQGNYVPQAPAQTWELRYGDCKAKTLLLLSLLHALKIEAEPVLASIQASGLVANRLPSAGAFDHVLVHATIGGEALWLDGTASGARLDDLRDTPPFRNVLPVRMAGATLMPLPMRASARPDVDVTVDLDQSAGIYFPTLYRVALKVRGQNAEFVNATAKQATKEQRQELVRGAIGDYVGENMMTDNAIAFDEASGTVTLSASGLITTGWRKENQRYRLPVDVAVGKISFDPDRARAAWKDIPVATGTPSNIVVRTRIRLPESGKGYTLEGDQVLPPTLAGVQLSRTVKLDAGVLAIDDRMVSLGAEVASADIAGFREKVSRAQSHLLTALAPTDYPPRWQAVSVSVKDGRFRPILALYAKDIAADPDKALPYLNRASFLAGIYDRRGAIADLGRAIGIEPNVATYLRRAQLLDDLGEKEKALADVLAARKIDPGSTDALGQLASLDADRGAKGEALALLQERIDAGGKDKPDFLAAKADVQSTTGDGPGAIATIDAAVAASPGNPDLLNSRCWLKGTLNVMLDTALKDCTKSIELSDSPIAALDSRAMVYFRMGRMEDALSDLNAALDLNPDLPGSLFLRGIVRKRTGQGPAATVDLGAARMMSPSIDRKYARYGIAP